MKKLVTYYERVKVKNQRPTEQHIYVFVLFFFIMAALFPGCGSVENANIGTENEEPQLETETQSYYKVKNNNGELEIQFGWYVLFTGESEDIVSLDNLELTEYTGSGTTMYYYVSANVGDAGFEAEVRESLLKNGLAKLADEGQATTSEIEAQSNARENSLGIWANVSDADALSETIDSGEEEKTEGESAVGESENGETETAEVSSAENEASEETAQTDMEENVGEDEESPGIFQRIAGFFKKIWELMNYPFWGDRDFLDILIALGVFSALGAAVSKALRTRSMTAYLGGAVSSGKSTMFNILRDPDAGKEELLDQSPTLSAKGERRMYDENNRKHIIKLNILDSPGDSLYNAIDRLSKSSILRGKYVLIIIFAATKSNVARNSIDDQYIAEQLSAVKNFWAQLLRAEKIKKPKKVVMFVNKTDLYDTPSDMEKHFAEHKKYLLSACKDTTIGNGNFMYIAGSIINRKGLKKVKKVLCI